jgi:glycosyltransferase involved in cell wall biosynthesis
MLSVVIPIHNEEPSVLALYDRLTSVLESLSQPYEIIFVDDASTDRSFALLANLLETDSRLKVVRLRRNFGQTAALQAGIDWASGDVIATMDGDLQVSTKPRETWLFPSTEICSMIPPISRRCWPKSTKGTISPAVGGGIAWIILSRENFHHVLPIGSWPKLPACSFTISALRSRHTERKS